MNREEFTRKVKAAAFLAAKGECIQCHVKIVGGAEYDHILPCALGGEATLDNCQVLCSKCHRAKTKTDVQCIRKADRQRDKANGALARKGPPMAGTKASKFKRRMDGTVEWRS